MNIWHVTTEAREDGRGTRSLGYFSGSVKDIAIKCYQQRAYNLHFQLIKVNHVENENWNFHESDISINFTYDHDCKVASDNLDKCQVIFETNKKGFLNKTIKIYGAETLFEQEGLKHILTKIDELDDKHKEKLKNILNKS